MQSDPHRERIAETTANMTTDKNINLPENTHYMYTVASYENRGDIRVYGNVDLNGLSGTTVPKQVELLSLEESGDGVTITWEPLNGVDGYRILRRVNNGKHTVIGETDPMTTSFTDNDYDPDLPCRYSVRSYKYYRDGISYGYMKKTNKLLLLKPLSSSNMSAVLEQTGVLLTRNTVPGTGSYPPARLPENGWKILADTVSDNAVSYPDKDIETAGHYSCRVTPMVINGEERHEYPAEPISIYWETPDL